MTSSHAGGLLRFVRGLAAPAWADATPDARLLQQFATERDEGAFAALVRRHGPMVLGVCRRVLAIPQDAEDAFQAAFLVLARRVHSIARPERLGNWLYGVAYRTALEAKRAARRRLRERQVRDLKAEDPADAVAWADLRPVLDQEISRLPEKYRAPFVLCYLEGRTNEEAAQLLGCPRGTVLSRLARAREASRARLTRRGVILSGGALAAALTQGASAAVPQGLTGSTARAAVAIAAGAGTLRQLVSANVAAILQKALAATTVKKLRTFLTILTLAGLLAVGGALGYGAAGAGQEQARPAAPAPARDPQPPRDQSAGFAKVEVERLLPGEAKAFRSAHTSGSRLAFLPGGNRVVLSSPQVISTLDLATGKEVPVPQGPRDRPYRLLRVSPQGHLLVGRLLVQDINRPPTGTLIADLTAGKELGKLETGNLDGLAGTALSPDGRILALAWPPTTVTLWDVRTGKRLGTLEGKGGAIRYYIHALAFSADGQLLAAGSGTGYPVKGKANGAVGVWDVRTRKLLHALPSPESQVNALAFSPDGTLLAGGGVHSQGLRLWEVKTGKERVSLKHTGHVQCFDVTFSPDGKTVAANWRAPGSGDTDAGVVLWEAATGRLRGILKGQRQTVTGLAFSPDGHRLAAIDSRGTVRMWQADRSPAGARP